MNKKYFLHRSSSLKVEEFSKERDVWKAIGELPFGEGYEVLDEHGNVYDEFIPF